MQDGALALRQRNRVVEIVDAIERRKPPDAEPPVGPVDSSRVPRFAGPATFARLPRIDEVVGTDVAVVGVPFDSGVSYRPGARFGPRAIRQATYHSGSLNSLQLGIRPLAVQRD